MVLRLLTLNLLSSLFLVLLGTRGPLTQSGSHDYHNSSKTLFFGNVAQDGILCWRTDKPLTMNVNLLCHLRKTAGVHCLLLISLYNNVPMGMERVGNRLFISLPRRRYGIPTTLNYIDLDQNVNTRSPALNPYPDILQGRNLTSVYRTRADECGRLWMVDTGLLELPVNPIQIQPPAIVVFDLNTDSQIFRYQFKSTDIPAANTPTGLASITVDVIGGDCSNTFAYVPDLTTFGIIVFSLRDNDSWRLSHNFFSFNPTAGALNIAGHRFQWSDGIFSITLREPEANGCRTAYFHALVSTQEFAVNTCLLRNRTASSDSNYWQMYRAPKIVKNQRVIETSIGNLLIFSCKLRNDSPAAKIKWKFKSIQSKKYVDIKPPAVEDPFVINKVIIASVSKKDVGSYKCIATNEAGQDEHIFEVKIKAPATEPPQIDKTFRMFRATAKYPFALNCKIVGGHPATQITWQYRKRQNAQYKKLKQKGEVLMFKSAQISDTGYYRCVAVNEAGTDSHVMRLYVKETFKRSRIEGTGDELIQKSKLRPPMKRNKQRKPRKGWSSTDSESDSDSSSDSNSTYRPIHKNWHE
ncbi:hypothetical protein MSG28_016228, partial [Choristoneura fumiferana]